MAFPADPLDVRSELYLDGAWVDISDDVRVASGVSITRGQPDEGSQSDPARCVLTIDNRDGKYSPRNPSSPYYGVLGRNTPIRVSVADDTVALRVDGSNVLAATTPDASALDISGDLDIRCLVALDRWSSSTAQTFVGKDEFAYSFGKDESDLLRLEWTSDDAFRAARSSVPVSFPDGSAQWVRVVYDKDSGGGGHSTTFYTSDDGTTWDQLGDPVTGTGTGSIAANTTALALGNRGDLVSPMSGRVYKVEVRDGSTVVANPDFTAQAEGTTSFTDDAGRTWTITAPYEVTSKVYRFHGEVSSWPSRWDLAGVDVEVPIEAAGILRRLGQGSDPLKSAMYRGLTSPGLSTGVIAYWPCEDGEGSSSLASAVGGPPMIVRGAPKLGEFDEFACSEPIPVLNDAEYTGTVPSYANTGETQVRFLLAVPEAGETNGQTIIRLRTTGSANRWELDVGSLGSLALRAYTGESSQVLDTDYVTFEVNGALLRVSIELTQDGSDVDYAVTTLAVGQSIGFTTFGTLAGYTVGNVSKVVVSPTGGVLETVVGHLSVETGVSGLFDLADQLNAWDSERAGARIARLCEEEGIELAVIGDTATTTRLGPQRSATLLDLLTEAAEADVGILSEPRDRFGLLYRTRESLCNQRAAVTLDYDGRQVSAPFEPVDDDQATRNDITVKRAGGSSARAVLDDGPLSVNDPPGGVGRYTDEVEVTVQRDGQLSDQAGWRLHLGTVDEARYPSVTVDLTAEAVRTNDELLRSVKHAELGDLLVVEHLPSWLPPGDARQLVRGVSEYIGQFDWAITAACSPASPWTVGVYGTARYGTAGSGLASAVDEDETTLSVSTTTGPLWTVQPYDLPFTVRVGAEEMTVTAVSGSSSPQTFTVTRAVNGVAQSHDSGAAVTLAVPSIRAL